ncbi:XRE family transcriptional regulator [Acinetobacter defluvii]|uniref:XRE family transcriptional regulator n=1 Tax=Acinetobacter defluvii TaxID=1871111 RepID=A0A2S2FE58_9GAMM|nr:hypothetical protein [Acinetobacter defluvii]AWL29253.1 XRE family transcriptional regulator [Acinetobacter defluvii]
MTYWSQLINELQDKEKGNMSQHEIAAQVPCSQNYISELKAGKKGKRISHEIAKGLEDLHKKKVQVS